MPEPRADPAPPPALPVVPATLLVDGEVRTGRFVGRAPAIDWRGLNAWRRRPAWWRVLRHKRWQYVGLSAPGLFIGVAIVDLGWALTAFAYLFDRRQGRLLADWSADGLRPWSGHVSDELLVGAQARFRGLRSALSVVHERATDDVQVSVVVPGLSLQARLALAGAPPLMLATGTVSGGTLAGGAAHATQKSSALSVQGRAVAAGRSFDLGDAWATLDGSNGLLPRRTRWLWACAHGPGLGFNLQCGYFGDHENMLWLQGRCIPLGPVDMRFDVAQPLQPWHIRTRDGLLDLTFHPEGARGAARNLGLVASRYVQPVGTFQGWVRPHAGAEPIAVHGLPGVTEDHDSLW